MSLMEFATVIGTLAVATGRTMDDEAMSVYYVGLQDVPMPVFQRAVGRLITSAKFFPSVGEIRASCDFVHGRSGFRTFTLPAIPAGVMDDDDPRIWYACVTCQDSGWAPHWCRGAVNAAEPVAINQPFVTVGPCGSCERMGSKGYGHEYMKRCACYQTNPTIRKRLDERRKYTEAE